MPSRTLAYFGLENFVLKLIAVVFISLALLSLSYAQEGKRNIDVQSTSSSAEASVSKESRSIAAVRARIRDAEAVATLTAEGQATFGADPNKGSFTKYKYGAYKLIDQGEFRQAIRSAAVALFISADERNDTQTAYAKLILATAYLAAGDLDNAQVYATAAKKHSIHLNYRSDVLSTADKLLGDVALRQKKYDEAISLYDQSIDATLGDLRFYSRLGLAQALASANRYDKARKALADADGYVGVIGAKFQPAAKGSLLRIRGMVALAEGKADEATKLYEDALKTQGSDEDAAYDKFWVLEGLGRAKLSKGDKEGALNTFRSAIDESEKVRGRFHSEELKSALFGEMQDVFSQATRLLVESGQVDVAWEVNERGRARALLDMLRNRVELASGSAVFAEASGKSIKLSDLIGYLKPNEAVISYRVLEDRTYAWVSRKTGSKIVTIAVGRKDLAQSVQEFRDSIVEDKDTTKVQGASLYNLLIKPLALAPGEAVSIIPHESLHYLPFQALWAGDKFLLQSSAVSYAPSAAALLNVFQRQVSKNGKFLALGNPDLGNPALALPGAQKEVEALIKLFPSSESYFLAEATRDRLLKGAPQARFIHVAAHGTVDAVDPLYSKLHLAKEPNHPGTVEARDIYGLKLEGTDLIALSACESGLGKVSRGDEIWGFTRSFLSAGAPALLVSLWPVSDDATEILMKRFYGELTKGVNRRQALREAELAVLADSRFSSPFFWAAFNLVGDSR